MHDPERVRLGDRLARLQHVADGAGHRERAAPRHGFGQILALEILHHHVRRARRERADIGDARDVLALDLHRGPCLANKPVHDLRMTEHLRQQELERDTSLQLHVRRRDDHAHAADAEHALDAILAVEDFTFADRRDVGR